MNEADKMKIAVACYFRYDHQYPIVAFEVQHFGYADVLIASPSGHIIEVEVKLTKADLKSDINKDKHYVMLREYKETHPQVNMFEPESWKGIKRWEELTRTLRKNRKVSKFYFAVSPKLVEDAKIICEQMYPYAGILLVRNEPYLYSRNVVGVARKAFKFKGRDGVLTTSELNELIKQMSSTLCRTAIRVMEFENKQEKENNHAT